MSTLGEEKMARGALADNAATFAPPPPLQAAGAPPSSAAREGADSLPDMGTKESQQPHPTRTKSSVTVDSELADLSPEVTKTSSKKPWYRRLNPLKRSRKPPVPRERTVCPEYGAPWWSLLTFHWMAPLMRVCHFCLRKNQRLYLCGSTSML